MPKKNDKTAGRPHEDRMEVGGESTADVSTVKKSIVSAAGATFTSNVGGSSSVNDLTSQATNEFESRMARLESHIERMSNVMAVHFGSGEEEQDPHIPEEDELGGLGMQDGGGDAPQLGFGFGSGMQDGAPQPGTSGQSTSTTTALWAEISQELKLDDELAAPLSPEVAQFLEKCIRKKPSAEAEKIIREDRPSLSPQTVQNWQFQQSKRRSGVKWMGPSRRRTLRGSPPRNHSYVVSLLLPGQLTT
jgi:hypothetical protein